MFLVCAGLVVSMKKCFGNPAILWQRYKDARFWQIWRKLGFKESKSQIKCVKAGIHF